MFYFAKYIVSVERLNKHEQMDSTKKKMFQVEQARDLLRESENN